MHLSTFDSGGQNRRRTRAHVIPSGSLDDPEVQDAMDRLFNKAHSACTAVKRRAMSEREWLQARMMIQLRQRLSSPTRRLLLVSLLSAGFRIWMAEH
jgi:hypothetical protein